MAWLQSPDMQACALVLIRTKNTATAKHEVETKWRQIWCYSTAMMFEYSVKLCTSSWCIKNTSGLVCKSPAALMHYISFSLCLADHYLKDYWPSRYTNVDELVVLPPPKPRNYKGTSPPDCVGLQCNPSARWHPRRGIGTLITFSCAR